MLAVADFTAQDRALLAFWTLFLNPRRVVRSAITIKASILLRFHDALKKRKYRLLYSPGERRKPGPKVPSKEVIPDKAGQALGKLYQLTAVNLAIPSRVSDARQYYSDSLGRLSKW